MPALESALAQTHVAVTPGIETRVEINVTNTSDVIDGVTAIVDGINPDWVRLERPLVSLFPASTERLAVIFDLPRTCPAGDYLVVVRVVSTLDPERGSVHDFWLSVGVVAGLDVELRPSIVTGGSSARFEALIRNTGNAAADVSVSVLEPTRVVDCVAEPSRIVLGHGAEAVLPVVMRGPRPWFGQPIARQIHVGVSCDSVALDKVATFNQKPRIPRGLITVLTLMAIVALWALIFLWVVTELRSDEPAGKAVGSRLFTGPPNVPISEIAGEARGTVTAATTGEGLARITVEAWRVKADGSQSAVASAASGDDGTFALPSLIPGRYRFRFSAEGFAEVWFTDPDAPPADASTPGAGAPGDLVRIEPKETVPGLDMAIGGAAGTITGKIALPPGSADVPLTVTATLITETSGQDDGTVVERSQITTDGTVALTDLPTPGTYQITVTGPGFATQSFQQAVGGGQAAVLNTVTLSAASGTIEGRVVDGANNALGGVDVVARFGDIEYRATTPTDVGTGAFRLVGLPTPGTYVLTFTKEGYSGETQALNLPAGGTATTSARLIGGSGTIAGQVSGADGNPLGGVTVDAVCDEFVAAGATLTTNGPGGAAGSFTITGLPVPSDCTVTFSSDGYQTETYSAAFTNAGLVGVGPVTMLPVEATIEGTVRSAGVGVGEITVTATDGTRSQVTTSATSPAGRYAFEDLSAGAYTVTFSRPGYATRVILVTVAEGDAAVVDVDVQPLQAVG